MSKPYYKSNEEIALLLALRPCKTEAGRKVARVVLTRIEIAMAEAELARDIAQ